MNHTQITRITGREILDSRGNPTVEATVFLSGGTVGVASVPSGASTGIYEATELRDGDAHRFFGKGVCGAVNNIGRVIFPALSGISVFEQVQIDSILCDLDGTKTKSRLGANATLAVSLAVARAAANELHIPLYRYLGGATASSLPVPMMNILNGGAHASNNVDIQEFMIAPVGAESFSQAMEMGCTVYHTLGKILKSEGYSTAVGDEGGFAPDLSGDEEALELISRAIEESGYTTEKIKIALDCAAGEWFCDDGSYHLPKRKSSYSREGLCELWGSYVKKYPIFSIEDGLDQRDFEGFSQLTKKLGDRIMLVGDDLFVTNPKRLYEGIAQKAANTVLVKPNQIGTLSETMEVINIARQNGYKYIPSHRSGDTEDTTLADIAVATGAPFIKCGAPCRTERVAKYNRLIRIESALASSAKYGWKTAGATQEQKAPMHTPAAVG